MPPSGWLFTFIALAGFGPEDKPPKYNKNIGVVCESIPKKLGAHGGPG